MIFANMSHAAIETLVQKISPPATLCNRWSQLVDVDKCPIFGWRQLVSRLFSKDPLTERVLYH